MKEKKELGREEKKEAFRKRRKERKDRAALLNPKNLQKEIDEFGYSFSQGKYLAFIIGAIAGSVLCGIAFSLEWYFILMIAVTGIICIPALILSGYKNMYEHKRFLDISDYMEQILYSFRSTNKILYALKDTQTLYEAGGKMYETIQKAADYIENGKEEEDIYREAFSILEEEYPCKRLRSIHEYLKSVEENGGENEGTIDLLLQDKSVWADNIVLLQEDKKSSMTKIFLSIVVTIVLALIFHAVYRSMPVEYSIVRHPVTQAATTVFLILDILIFKKANKELSKSWIEREGTNEEKILKYYQMVTEYDEGKERKKSLRYAAPFFIAAVPFLAFGKFYISVGCLIIGILLMNQHRIGYRTAYDVIVKEINQTFPGWLMNMALLLQANNVQVSIAKTIPYAPAVLRMDLEQMVERLKAEPNSVDPYLEFLKMFKLSSVQSAMKMLYAISESGTGDAQTQITVLVQRNSKLLDKAEKLQNEKSLAGMNGIFYFPQVAVSFQTMINMVVFMLVFLGRMAL